MLTNNNITELGDLDALAKCPKLEYLSLIGNPITHKQYYRQYVIYKLKNVRVLDYRRVRKVVRKLVDNGLLARGDGPNSGEGGSR